MRYELQTLERALDLLSELATESPLRLTDFTERLQTNQTTVLRTLRVLERHGYIRRLSGGTDYWLGTRLTELGLAAVSGIDAPTALRPWTSALSREFGATVHIGMLRDGMITIVGKLDSPDSRVQYSSLGTRMPLHATAAGKAALAMLAPQNAPQDFGQVGLVAPLQMYTPHSVSDLDALRSEIALTSQRGFSTEREEYQLGFGCVGYAFRLGDDIFTVSISGPLVSAEDLDRRGERLRASMDDFLEQYRGAARGMTAR